MTDPHPPGHPEAAAPLGSSEHEALVNDYVEEFAEWSGSEDEALWETAVGDGINPTRARRSHAIRHASDGLEGARLLPRLIAAGDAAAASEQATELQSRLDAIDATSGIFSGIYPPGYLEDLREEWPE